MDTKKLPLKLYKYRAFNTNSLRLLCRDEVYYANPNSFNDPLDCKPTIHIDTNRVYLLEKLYYRMLIKACDKNQLSYQMLQTAYDKEPTLTEIKKRMAKEIKEQALKEIRNERYMSTEIGDFKTEPTAEEYYIRRLVSAIQLLLDKEMASRGVLSLSERWDCPLMWSHYSDEHRGICLEYDTSQNLCSQIKSVDYQGPRSINLTDLIEWKLHKSVEAEDSILNTYFFTKARDWEYEEEWRDIYLSNGSKPSPFRISGVYFGLRCDIAVKTSIVNLLYKFIQRISFYELYELKNEFRLERRKVDIDETLACGVELAGGLIDMPFIVENI